jgi:hypothetical protein
MNARQSEGIAVAVDDVPFNGGLAGHAQGRIVGKSSAQVRYAEAIKNTAIAITMNQALFTRCRPRACSMRTSR